MPLFSSSQPSIRAKILPRFPAQVLAGTGIQIVKNGGTYVFSTSGVPLSSMGPIGPLKLLGRDNSVGPPQELNVSAGLLFTGAGGIGLSDNQRARSLAAQFSPTVTAGRFQDFVVPLTCKITRVTLLANTAGNAVVDILRTIFANHPPVAGDSICAGVKPSLAAAFKSQGTTDVGGAFAGWASTINAGDIIRINVDSVSTLTQLSVSIDVLTQ